MTHCLFGLPAENWAATGVLTASAQLAGLEASQLATPHGATSTSWQTPAGTTAAWVLLDARTPLAWGAMGLFNAHLSAVATVRWRLGNDALFASPVYDSGPLGGTVAPGYRQSVHVLPAEISARYLRVDIADPLSPDGFLRVGQMFAGPARRPLRNFGFQSAFQRSAEAPVLRTRGGQRFTDYRYAERAWSLSLPSLATADVWPLVQELQRSAETGANLLFIPFPAGADIAREAVFGTLSAASAVTWPSQTPRLRAWSATITERL
jgi:hypothetical protein